MAVVVVAVTMAAMAVPMVACCVAHGFAYWHGLESGFSDGLQRGGNGFGRCVNRQGARAELKTQAAQSRQLGQGVANLAFLRSAVHGRNAENQNACRFRHGCCRGHRFGTAAVTASTGEVLVVFYFGRVAHWASLST